MERLSDADLTDLRQAAYDRLKSLVTPEGIFASEAIGWDGPYHAWFGRDGAITADFLLASIEFGGDRELAAVAIQALKKFADWQGRADNPSRGEEQGKIPHEIRTEFSDIQAVQHAARTNKLPWFIDPEDGVLKNWDTADATPLWTVVMLRSQFALGDPIDGRTQQRIRAALDWILRNIEDHDGLVGFTGADLQPERQSSGLHNQGWKDTEAVYQTPEGENAPHPIKDVLVNAEAWAALKEAAIFFGGIDQDYSQELDMAAGKLKACFNSKASGFVSATEESVLAQAIDGNGARLEQSAVDQGAVLWARTSTGEVCVDEPTEARIVEKMLSDEMFNPEAGVRDYAKGTIFTHGTNYHGSPNTYWPFMSGMVAQGMERAGFEAEAERVMRAYLNAIKTLGTNIEMFIQDEDDQFEPWSHPDPEIGQKSSREQAWTAAAVYYATNYLLAKEER